MTRADRDIRGVILGFGDLAAAYLSLLTMLYLRYGTHNFPYIWRTHAWPFAAVFVLWLVVLFIVGLDDIDELKSRFALVTKTAEAFAAAFLLSLGMFYIVPFFRIAPKASLVVVTIIYAAIFMAWRLLALHLFSRPQFRSRVVFLGKAPEVRGV